MKGDVMKTLKSIPILAGLFIITAAASLHSQGFIVPGPGMPSPYLIRHKVEVEIVDQVARVIVRQTFYNISNRSLEGRYCFPLPKDASITDFEMIVDGKVMKGELLEKEKARRIYEDIVRRQIDPALLEYAGHNLFSASIFPIPPKEEREITLEYSSLLVYDGNVVRFSYPLRGQVSAGRTGRNVPVRHPSGRGKRGGFWNPDREDVTQVIDIRIRSKNPIKNIYSPSHNVDISRRGDHRASVTYEGERKAVSESFKLFYSYSEDDLGLSLMTFKDHERKGYFMLLLSPKTSIGENEILGKDILFILDTSGSMGGEKIEQAREALSYCINHLNDRDRFNIITFSTETRFFREEMVPYRENRKSALAFVRRTEARGGTNIHEALLLGLRMKFERRRSASIVFITDGLPTVGVTDAAAIVRNIDKANRNEVKIFTFGVGYDVNTMLLDRIAQESQAVSDYIEPEENLEEKITGFYAKISHPVMTGLDLDFGRVKVSDVYPKSLPDLFKDSQLVVLGRYRGGRSGTVMLRGWMNGKEKVFRYNVRFNADEAYDFIPHLWATRKIGFLMDEIRLHGENGELKEEIIRLSKKHGVMSPYTSYLVQEEDKLEEIVDVRRDAEPGTVLQRRKSGEGAGRAMDLAAAPAVGAVAVRNSKVSREMKEAESVPSMEGLQRVRGRTFYMREGFWVDQEYTDQKTIDLKAGSDAVVNLMLEFPETAKFLAMGEKVIFKFKDRFVKVSDQGEESLSRDEVREMFR
jgi:Ca-activated chloride channel family protein